MANERKLADERAKEVIDVWKTIVEVQQHFNDIGMRIRSMFVTILLALFASIGFLWDKKFSLEIGPLAVKIAVFVPLFGVFGAILFYFIDRYWYHRLLVASVNHAIEIEKKYKAELPELSLSEAIGKESPYKPTGIAWVAAKILVRHDKFKKSGNLHSDGKIELFYKSIIFALIVTSIILFIFGGANLNK